MNNDNIDDDYNVVKSYFVGFVVIAVRRIARIASVA